MGLFDAFKKKKVQVSTYVAENKFSFCPFCMKHFSGRHESTCPECGEDLYNVQAVSFSCEKDNNAELVKEIKEWLSSHNVKLSMSFETETENDQNNTPVIKKITFYYKEYKGETAQRYGFDIICSGKSIADDTEIDLIEKNWKESKASYGANTIQCFSTAPDSRGYKNITMCILYEEQATSLKIEEVKMNPELNKCPYCGEYLFPKSNHCSRCGKDFSEVCYIELSQNEWDNTLIFEEVRRIISDSKKEILSVETTTSSGTASSNGKKWKDSFIDSMVIYYLPLEVDRKYTCGYEQIARYKSIDTEDDGKALVDDWISNHQGRSTVTTYQYSDENGSKYIDIFVLYYVDDPVQEPQANIQEVSETKPVENPIEEHIPETKELSDIDKQRIEEAGKLYEQKRYLEAMETLVEFADRDSDCSFKLGYMYGKGFGVPKDDEKACYWYEISARLGDRTAKINLGRRYQNGNGIQKDESKAVELFMSSALQGEREAMYELACCYDKGKGTAKNETQALLWYRKAIEAGRKKDYFDIAYLLHCGSEKVKDYKEAAKYYELSIEEGCAAAACNLGNLYYNGFGVEKNKSKAIQYYEIGASKGSAVAMKNLAEEYETGKYIEKDLTKALEWFEKAASKGNAEAKKGLERVKKAISEEASQPREMEAERILEEVSTRSVNQEEIPVMDKEHSMLNAFVDFLNSSKKKNFEVRLAHNMVVWTVSTEKLQSARFVIIFKPETNARLQYAYIRLYSYVDFPAEKKDVMYKVCNEANIQFNGVDFFVDETDNSITINMRSGFTRELCGQQCVEDIYSLSQAADKVYPLFMKAIWA